MTLVHCSSADVIGDVHGCRSELVRLLELAQWRLEWDQHTDCIANARSTIDPDRVLVFLGDLVNRGPESVWCYRSLHNLIAAGRAYCVKGNHEWRLGRALPPATGTFEHSESIDVLVSEFTKTMGEAELSAAKDFLQGLPAYLTLKVPGARALIVAHAGIDPEFVGKTNRAVRERTAFGVPIGVDPDTGYPIRSLEWTASWRDSNGPFVVYGHSPLISGDPDQRHETVNIDTACVFGGRLTMLRWPSCSIVQVPCERAGGYAPTE